jgi:hypothetical protein
MSLEQSLLYSYSDEVEGAYIIRIEGNETSEMLSSRCAKSLQEVGMKWEYWKAFDGTAENIEIPEDLKNQSWLKLIKFTSYKMTKTEIACALSHISLWIKCIELDRPIVILEHDAVLWRPYLYHAYRNSICWLGNRNGLNYRDHPNFPLTSPPMPGETPTTIHIDTCMAYAIDPLSANNLLVALLDRGLYAPVDIMVKSNRFCIVQTGIYNIGENKESTIDRYNNYFHNYGLDPRQ